MNRPSCRIRPYRTSMDVFGLYLKIEHCHLSQMRRSSKHILLLPAPWRACPFQWTSRTKTKPRRSFLKCSRLRIYKVTWIDAIASLIRCSEGGDWSGWRGRRLDWTRSGMWNIVCLSMELIQMIRSTGPPARQVCMYNGPAHTTEFGAFRTTVSHIEESWIFLCIRRSLHRCVPRQRDKKM